MKKLRIRNLMLVLVLALLCACGGLTGVFAAAEEDTLTAEYLLSASSWRNLPGYKYVALGVEGEDGPYPAQVTFGEDANGVGINLKMQGYYQSQSGDAQGNEYAGIVLKDRKVSVENFSLTFTINKLGASTGASPAEDGWVAIALVREPNLFHTTNTTVNSGAVMLLRPSNRSVELRMHEVAENSGSLIANFGGNPSPPSVGLDLTPATEGATLRFSIVTETSGSTTKYKGKLEQLNFAEGTADADQEVIGSKTTSMSLLHPDWYLGDDASAYLAISTSTDNFNKQWDISIKNICGVDIGKKADTAPISATKRADNIYALIDTLRIYDYFLASDGSMTAEGQAFYVPDAAVDINALATDFAVQLYNADNEVLSKLCGLDADGRTMFATDEAYLAFLNSCKDKILAHYEDKFADKQIAALQAAVQALPALDTVTLATEQETYVALQNTIDAYFALTVKAQEKIGTTEYTRILEEVIKVYEERLAALSMEKYRNLAEELPASVTLDTLKEAVFAVVPAEKIYANIEERVRDMEMNSPAAFAQIQAAKQKLDEARTQINALKADNARLVESYEKGAAVRYDIFYLPNPATAEHAKAVFDVLVSYGDLSSAVKKEITADERATLLATCKSALEASIAALPDESAVTEENYLSAGYDIAISDANNRYNLLDDADGTVAQSVSGVAKLRALVNKLSAVSNPLSAAPVESKSVRAGETVTLAYGDMFRNYFGRTYTTTANYGTTDDALETFTVQFDKAGDYTVTVTITDTQYNQSATCTFTVKVSGGSKGCKGAVAAPVTTAGIVALIASALLAAIRRRRTCH